MKTRLINVLKCSLMVLGVIFLIQMILFIGATIGLTSFYSMDLDKINSNKIIDKPMKKIVKYVEEYKTENGKYPDKIDSSKIKIKPDTYFEYKTNDEKNCYTLILKAKEGKYTKQYNRCSSESDGFSSNSESYVEFNK